ncbi:MAG: asparagine synthase (glutamine-hydrolyzing) [Pseudomonadota bacterium]
MCGIHGLLAFAENARPDPGMHTAMGAATRHRGPDDHGFFCEGPVLIGMRRLSIIDVAGGHQPLTNADESVQLVCNGEIYNFRELREELKAKGYRFRTGSDSEVIVHLYQEHGDAFVERLRGMFGFALWDRRRERLLIGRDRLGIKPLYYTCDAQRVAFASEAKALFALPGMQPALCAEGLQQYLSFGYTTTPHSLFDGVRKLPAGSMLVCENGTQTIRRYWQPQSRVDTSLSADEWAQAVRRALEESVAAQMVSDVPLGAFLSGGIDSSAVVAMMARHSDKPVRTYAIGFDASSGGQFYNELPFARQVADRFGTQHKEITVRPDVATLVPRLLYQMDEPMADAAFITTYLVAEFARKDVTVILSGVGGDELFGGYRRYLGEHYGAAYRRLPAWLRRRVLTPVARRLPSDRHSKLMNLSRYARSFILADELPFEARYRAYVEVFSKARIAELCVSPPSSAPDALDAAFEAVQDGDAVNRLMTVDMLTQLPDDLLMLTDKMTMATSLECRVPLLDERLVDLCLTMPAQHKIRGRELKAVLKTALADVLPHDILYRPKRGFGAPMGAWIKNELAPLLNVVLSQESIERRGLFHWPVIRDTIEQHRTAQADHTDHLLALFNLELWARLWLDGTTPADLTESLASEAAA